MNWRYKKKKGDHIGSPNGEQPLTTVHIKCQTSEAQIVKPHSARQTTEPPESNTEENGTTKIEKEDTVPV